MENTNLDSICPIPNNFKLHLLIGTLIFPLLILFGCTKSNCSISGKLDIVEVSPNKWIQIRKLDSTHDDPLSTFGPDAWTHILVPWNGKTIDWKTTDIPICLREHDKLLYAVGFDRETDFKKPTLRYYKQDILTFSEIPVSEFPKVIATQNMWLSLTNDSGQDGDIQLTRNLDPRADFFPDTFTALMWFQIETGKEYYELQNELLDKNILIEYKRKYKPVALPNIIKD